MIVTIRRWWTAFVAALGVIVLALVYRKGRTDVEAKVETRETKRANEILERGAEARRDAAAGVGRTGGDNGLRDPDKYQRD